MASSSITITLRDEAHRVVLLWDKYDGDDCFDSFKMTVAQADGTERLYDFGPCATLAPRKMKSFLANQGEVEVHGGFQFPDVRTYEWRRTGSELKLTIEFARTKLHDEYVLKNPIPSIEETPYQW